MPFVPAPNVVQVEMMYLQGAEVMENVYHVIVEEIGGEAFLIGIADDFIAWETASGRLRRSSGVSLTGVRVTALDQISSPQIFKPVSPPIAGAVGEDVQPGNVTFAVKANTTRGGRGSQGRTFWIGLSETSVTSNFVLQSVADGIVTQLNALITAVSTGTAGAQLAVLHSKAGGVELNPRVATPITSYSYRDLVVDSQKSRLPGKRRKHHTTP